ncbi:inosine/guanosine kinase [Marinomonas posidonica]|uniref:Guanosine-inosine kinase n=1 Tax=Marinomonas posidonica (strain CECT 7376 / NCIMB 14433 / IVIA-Po-181) TaxID=491952 RepID=F6CXG8_MARPP|nr:inosine/guanosine kinase [Marinomonas posidonica]AEF55584.1 Inosine kinase [Marinomonas posidonica IVIA-Po-181]
MKFPGRRKLKHYFPVSQPKPILPSIDVQPDKDTYIVGLDETIVDVVANVSDEFLSQFSIHKGLSNLVDTDTASAIYRELAAQGCISDHFAGGTIGNTIHNYSVLADDKSVLLGVMSANITLGSPAYHYICHTSSKVDMNHLQGVSGDIGRGITLITPDGERTFAIAPGDMDELNAEHIPENIIAGSAALVTCAYPLRHQGKPIKQAMLTALEHAHQHQVPTVLTLGTKHLVEENKDELLDLIKRHVNVLAMNELEAEALTGLSDPLQAADQILEYVDIVLLTAGPDGMYLCGYTDDTVKRETTNPIKSGRLADFNRWEFSRPMLRSACQNPIKVFSHIDPYMGGPEKIRNTNGAGDGALSALLHDISANHFHKDSLPNSSKHAAPFLAYSSFAQICKYSNRVSYEILVQNAPRLSRGLPEREDSLEEAYWER